MRLLTALDSGVGEELKAAVEYNTSFFFSDPQSHSAELPETMWAMHTPYAFCPVLLLTKHAVAVSAGRMFFVIGSTQFNCNTDEIEQWDDKLNAVLGEP